MNPSRAKAFLGACLTLGVADLAVIDLQIAPALFIQGPDTPRPVLPRPAEAPERMAPVAITGAEVTRVPVSAVTPAANSVMREEYTILFATDNARLSKAAMEMLDSIAVGDVVEVSVDGYADPRGTTDYNQALSERRAAAIAEALTQRGVTVQRVRGNGATKHVGHVGGAFDADSLRRDRRVEVHIARRSP